MMIKKKFFLLNIFHIDLQSCRFLFVTGVIFKKVSFCFLLCNILLKEKV